LLRQVTGYGKKTDIFSDGSLVIFGLPTIAWAEGSQNGSAASGAHGHQ
jgi:hypothetical protein